MSEPVRVIREVDLIESDPTSGMLRKKAFELPILWAGRVETAPGAVSGWHHHDRNETSLYVVSGVLRLEFDGGEGYLDAEAGDFIHVPRLHHPPRVQPHRRALGRHHRPGRRRHPDRQRRRLPQVTRVVSVAPERLDRWLTGFGERHGETSYDVRPDVGDGSVGEDGSIAEIAVPFGPLGEADAVKGWSRMCSPTTGSDCCWYGGVATARASLSAAS